MGYLFSLTFQGQTAATASLTTAEERELESQAFPSMPPRDAAARSDYRAFKTAPLHGGRLLVTTASPGERDNFNRPVLTARGCVLEAAELRGALRDLGAVWEALADFDASEEFSSFLSRVERRSICTAPNAFRLFQSSLRRASTFHARVAGALKQSKVDLYLGTQHSCAEAPDLIRPALGLLPLSRLSRLHLVLGAERSEYREGVLGLAEDAPPDLASDSKRLLGGLFGGRSGPPVSVDLVGREVYGSRAAGPRWLAETIADEEPWPDGSADLGRYQMLLECLDTPELGGGAPTPFELRPKLDEMRRTIGRIESLSAEIARWRS